MVNKIKAFKQIFYSSHPFSPNSKLRQKINYMLLITLSWLNLRRWVITRLTRNNQNLNKNRYAICFYISTPPTPSYQTIPSNWNIIEKTLALITFTNKPKKYGFGNINKHTKTWDETSHKVNIGLQFKLIKR